MRRRLPKWAMTRMAIVCVALLVSGCEAQVWGTPPPRDTQAHRRPAGPTSCGAQGPTRPADGAIRRTRRPRPSSHRRRGQVSGRHRDRRAGPQHRPDRLQRGQQALPDRVGGEAVHRRRPAAAGVGGQDDTIRCRPQVTRHHAALLRRRRGPDLLEPQRWKRRHRARHGAVRVGGHDGALQRTLGRHA